MKRLTTAFCALFLLFSVTAIAQKEKAKKTTATEKVSEATYAAMPDEETMMKNWQAYMTPGKEHQMLGSWSGVWTAETTMWMSPDAPPTKSTATAEYRSIHNGLFQVSSYKGDFNGIPFEGSGVIGFDNIKKKFISVWYDNMGSGIMTSEGVWDEKSRTLTFTGKSIDPASGREIQIREVVTIIDENTHKMEMFCEWYDGKEFKTMEILARKNQ